MTDERYGWVVVAAAFTLLLVGFATSYSFPAFFSAFAAEFGASRGHIALVFSVAAFLVFLVGAPGGMLADRYGPRRVAIIGVACLAVALCLAATSRSLATLYVTYSIGIGIGVGLLYVPSVGAVQPWFGARRALASGIAVAGIGAGNIAGPLLGAWWIGLFGWRGGYLALALFVLLLGGAAALAVKQHPAVRSDTARGLTVAAAAKTRAFWLLYASLGLSCVGLFVPVVHLVPYALDAGYSEAQGVTLVSLIGVGSLLGRFMAGGIADRLGRVPTLALMYAGLGAMLFVWWSTSIWWLLALFSLIFGLCYGAYVALVPTIVMDLYGARSVSGIIGWLYTGAGIGTLIGPWFAGAAYDARGAYDLPIIAAAVLSFVAALCVFPLARQKTELSHSSH